MVIVRDEIPCLREDNSATSSSTTNAVSRLRRRLVGGTSARMDPYDHYCAGPARWAVAAGKVGQYGTVWYSDACTFPVRGRCERKEATSIVADASHPHGLIRVLFDYVENDWVRHAAILVR
jgi:hypothetical protein